MTVTLLILRHNEHRALRRVRVFRDRTNIMKNELDITSRNRLDRRRIFELVDVLAPHLERPTVRNFAIPPFIKFRRLHGIILSEIGDIHGISRSSVSRIMSFVIVTLATTLLHKIKEKVPSKTPFFGKKK